MNRIAEHPDRSATEAESASESTISGFSIVPVDPDFARRSAEYLAAKGYREAQIRLALVEQLDLTEASLDTILPAPAEESVSAVAA